MRQPPTLTKRESAGVATAWRNQSGAAVVACLDMFKTSKRGEAKSLEYSSSHSSHRCHAAVRDHHLAGDEGSFIRGKIKRQPGDLLRLADALQRRGLFELAPASVVLPEELAQVGLNESWRDGIDADVVRPEFLRPRAGHDNQAGFGETVEQAAWLGT